jgi:hypothetical protein
VSLGPLLAQAADAPVLFIPRIESHWLGMAIGFVSTAGGLVLSQTDFAGRAAWSWVALGGLLAGMLLHWRWKKADCGWRVDFARRRVEPIGVLGDAAQIEGGGWSIQVAPSDRRAKVAIDLRHEERGRVARLLDTFASRKVDQTRLSELADTIARRLNVARTGPSL